MKPTNFSSAMAPTEALEARFALRVVARLNDSVATLPHGISERLRVSRQQALLVAAQSRAVAKPAVSAIGVNRVLAWAGGPANDDDSPWWRRVAAVLPLILLVAGLLGIQELQSLKLINAAAEIDVSLLADDLPPHAYQDIGFLEFLKRPPSLE